MVWLLSLAWAGGGYEALDPDIYSGAVVAQPPEVVSAHLADLRWVSENLPEDCAKRWALGEPMTGAGARARHSWHVSWLRRRLTLEVIDVVPGDKVVWEYLGDKGFFVRFDLTEEDEGTSIAVVQPMMAPVWPTREVYHERIKPGFAQCWAQLLQAVDGPAPDDEASTGQ